MSKLKKKSVKDMSDIERGTNFTHTTSAISGSINNLKQKLDEINAGMDLCCMHAKPCNE